MNTFNTAKINIVYIYSLPDVISHRGDLKIGKASIDADIYDKSEDKELAIKKAAIERINRQGKEQDIVYELLHYEICVKNDEKGSVFTDKDVHKVLENSGFHNITHREDKKYGEWFKVGLDTAIKAINAVKEDRSSLDPHEKFSKQKEVIFRKGSQDEAIMATKKAISGGNKKFLWDAKMRFGKTLAALEVSKECGFKRTLIITHRPVVSSDWYSDFELLFYGTEYRYGSVTKGYTLAELLKADKPFVYFASMQDLRGSRVIREKLNSSYSGFMKNDELFSTEWDNLIIDEAHEGTSSELATAVLGSIKRKFLLALSGTPFNLMNGDTVGLNENIGLNFHEEEIYTWDYVMEQELKKNWGKLYPDEPNPYDKLPKLSIYTYDLNKYIPQPDFINIFDKAFNFREFFKTDESGNFVYEKDVKKFLDLIARDTNSNFPFSTTELRDNLRHTLWLLPGVKEARALEKLLKGHPIFTNFRIANVAGEGNEEEPEKDARNRVEKAIGADPSSSYSITLTCGRMTTGVSIPEWTAVFMLSNTSSSTTYLQTAFRAQTPYEYQGKIKTECYVFDFAPDRTLKVVADVMQVKKKETTPSEQRGEISKFLNFCPIISATNGAMKKYNTNVLLQAIKRVVIENVTKNGFDDMRLYNRHEFRNITEEDIHLFDHLQAIIGRSNSQKNKKDIVIAKNGFSDEDYERAKEIENKPHRDRMPEEIEAYLKYKDDQKQAYAIASILRGISIRMPMLIFGCNVDSDEDISIDRFVDIVDDESWLEFMPDGVTKGEFKKFTKFYDEEVFIGAGHDIRLRALAADKLAPLPRIIEITEIFKSFKNPDKETVLTPWSVVNKHLADSIGGADFNTMSENGPKEGQILSEITILPKWVENNEYANLWMDANSKILEINSKSGLYPLLATYNLFRNLVKDNTNQATQHKMWLEIIANNIYVVCKTPMAQQITRRTLVGYDIEAKVNALYVKDLTNSLRNDDFSLKPILNKAFNHGEDMKFDIVIGNPPYQGINGQQIYVDFYIQSLRLANCSCLIFPRSWRLPKNGNGLRRINNPQYKRDKQIVKITDYDNVFPGVQGASEVNVVLWKRNFDNGLEGKVPIQYADGTKGEVLLPIESGLHQKPESIQAIAQLAKDQCDEFLDSQISSRKQYGLGTDAFKNPGKYGMNLLDTGEIKVIGVKNQEKYIKQNDLVKKGLFDKWKVFIPYAWGNWSKNYLGGAYSDLVIAGPKVIAVETYIEYGPFKDEATATKAAKYLLTQFARGLIFAKKTSQHTTRTEFEYVPAQTFEEPWWGGSVADIQKQLFVKYKVPPDIQLYLTTNVQKKTEANFAVVTHD